MHTWPLKQEENWLTTPEKFSLIKNVFHTTETLLEEELHETAMA